MHIEEMREKIGPWLEIVQILVHRAHRNRHRCSEQGSSVSLQSSSSYSHKHVCLLALAAALLGSEAGAQCVALCKDYTREAIRENPFLLTGSCLIYSAAVTLGVILGVLLGS